MITPPPIITKSKKRTWPYIVALVAAAGCVAYIPFMFLLSIFTTPSIGEDDYLHEVEESPATLAEIGFKGSVIATRGSTLTLYTAKEETEFYTSPWRLYDLAGPNKSGHLTVFEIDQMKDDYRFTVVDFNTGSNRVVHQGSGDVIWDNVVGEMVMHPTEDKVIYFTETGNRQYPGAYASIGKLIELDLNTEKKTEVAKDVVDSEFAYSTDGNSIFFSRSTSDSQPQITQLVVGSSKMNSFGAGWRCALSHDGDSLFVFDANSKPVRTINIKTGNAKSLETSGYYFWPIDFVSDSLILASSLPLTKETAEYFPPTGSISGAHLKMRLGVFDPKGKRAAILRKDLDRYEPITHSAQMLSSSAFGKGTSR